MKQKDLLLHRSTFKSDRERIKAVAANEGIELVAIESLSNFCGNLMEERENNLAMMRYVLELANDLGVNMVKIFAAWPGIIDGYACHVWAL